MCWYRLKQMKVILERENKNVCSLVTLIHFHIPELMFLGYRQQHFGMQVVQEEVLLQRGRRAL
jgi:hypothetical protein